MQVMQLFGTFTVSFMILDSKLRNKCTSFTLLFIFFSDEAFLGRKYLLII